MISHLNALHVNPGLDLENLRRDCGSMAWERRHGRSTGIFRAFRTESAKCAYVHAHSTQGHPLDGDQERYSTWDEAVAGHATMLAKARAAEK